MKISIPAPLPNPRLIGLGRKKAAFSTRFERYATSDPAWHDKPRPEGRFPKPDHDELRKQEIEDELSRDEEY